MLDLYNFGGRSTIGEECTFKKKILGLSFLFVYDSIYLLFLIIRRKEKEKKIPLVGTLR